MNQNRTTMNIFPHTLIRIGGETYEEWARLQFDGTNATVDTIVKTKSKKEALKNKLSDRLLTFMQTLEDPKAQNLLQNIRRDIFNNRKLKNSKVNAAMAELPEEDKKLLGDFIQLHNTLKEQISEGEATYQGETAENRSIFKEIITNELLQKGLILSSRSLLDRVPSYIARDVRQFRKKELKTEQSLIKYLTRMYAKTSPFSTFTNLSIARLEGLASKTYDIKHVNTQEKVKGHIRLNNYLLKYILDLFKSYRAAYMGFYLRPNPTVESKQDHFFYLTNNNNIEAFQRIPFNPVVELILDSVKENREGIRFDRLIAQLLEQIDAEGEELEGYVKQLLDFGLLEYHIGVSGIDPDWDLKLIPKLEALVELEVAHVSELIEVLRNMRLQGEQYAGAGVEKRQEILSQVYKEFRDICWRIHEAAGLPGEERRTEEERVAAWKQQQEELKQQQEKAKEKGEEAKAPDSEKEESKKEAQEKEETFKHTTSTLFTFKPEQLFYEDTTREVAAVLDEGEVRSFVHHLNELLQALRLFKGMQEEKDKMKYYFLQKYGEEGASDLLTFYEDYFREFKKPEKEREEKRKKEAADKARLKKEAAAKAEGESLPAGDGQGDEQNNKDTTAVEGPSIPEIQDRQETMKSWNEAYENEISGLLDEINGEINLSIAALNKTNERIGYPEGESADNSFGCFVQFYEDKESGRLKAMLNGSFSGYGKMMSRFLHIFEEEVTQDLRRWNLSLKGKDSIFIEDCDASYFNANLHPPLLPFEVWMPGGHNTLPAEQQLPITDFEVRYDKEQQKVILRHRPSDTRAYVFDLGFQGHMGRSQLFQLLEKFSNADYLFTQPVVNAVSSLYHQKVGAKDTNKEEDNASDGKSRQKDEPHISVSPRIVFEDRIVLQRKSWTIPRALIPMREPMDSDWSYFLKVNEWRIAQDMPNEVFIFINPGRWGTANVDPELSKRLTRDDYKPQYIDFDNPLLVTLFEKTVVKVPAAMKIQEMLPSSEQMLRIDGQRYVSEFVVQWYTGAEPS